ncbi:LuxR C-terminal-related transcriptional regulator [Streptomyces sp. NPDC002659]|uniref:helix-turn-helix transcriptional regulator n=1 Tax=Streptomyces sp. NPDC002659 TaxID=3364656 RepID=UPI003683BE93
MPRISEVEQWPLIDRTEEIAAFTRALRSRRLRSFMVHGPAGVGKTRLAEECLAWAIRSGHRGGRALLAGAAVGPMEALGHLLSSENDQQDPVARLREATKALSGRGGGRFILLADHLDLLDSGSTLLINQLLETGVIFLIGTVSARPRTEALAAIVQPDRDCRVDLAEFDRERTEQLLHRVLGGFVETRTVDEFHGLSNGNLTLLSELVSGAKAHGVLEQDRQTWRLTQPIPPTRRLTEQFEGRLAVLDDVERHALDLLAVAGPLTTGDLAETTSHTALITLEAAHLVIARRQGRRTLVDLAHPAHADLLRARMPLLRKRALLTEQAARLRCCGLRRREDKLLLATWQVQATGNVAPELLLQAAAIAKENHDFPKVTLLLQALPETQHTAASLLLLGEAHAQLGKVDEAEMVFAAAEARATTERDRLGVALARTANLFWNGERLREALALNRIALKQMESVEGRLLLRANEATMLIVSGHPRAGIATLEQLPPIRGVLENTEDWLFGSAVRAGGLAILGRVGEALKLAERVHGQHLQSAESSASMPPAAQRVFRTLALTEAGHFAQARKIAEWGAAELSAKHAELPQLWQTFHLARCEWMAGRVAAAQRLYAETACLARARNQNRALKLVLSGLAACAAVLGNEEAAASAAAEARSLPAPGFLTGEERLGEAWVLAICGQLPAARQVLHQAADSAQASGHLASEAALLTEIARLGGAKEAAPRLKELAAVCAGELNSARAHFADALGARNAKRLLCAAEELESLDAVLLAAEAYSAAAEVLARDGQQRKATAAAGRAKTLVDLCGDVRTPMLAGNTETIAPLTSREREIALMAARRIPSKDIAQQLVLSRRTIDNHLNHVYTKLGVSSRSELSARLLSA